MPSPRHAGTDAIDHLTTARGLLAYPRTPDDYLGAIAHALVAIAERMPEPTRPMTPEELDAYARAYAASVSDVVAKRFSFPNPDEAAREREGGDLRSFTQIAGDVHQGDGGWSDAAYIATADPAAVLALLDALDAAEARLAAVREMVHRGARCPMCSSGMERRTVGMVYQLCGTDYGRADA